jgi:hypothetical protein
MMHKIVLPKTKIANNYSDFCLKVSRDNYYFDFLIL